MFSEAVEHALDVAVEAHRGQTRKGLAARLRRCLMNAAFLEVNSDALFRAHLLRALNRQAQHLSRALPDGLIGLVARVRARWGKT